MRSTAAVCAWVAFMVAGTSATGVAAQDDLATPPGVELPVVEHRLDNGLRLLVLPREGAPTVSTVVYFGVGGMHERPGSTGIVHLLEHLLFKGSSRVGTWDRAAEAPLLAQIDAVHDSLLALPASTDPAAPGANPTGTEVGVPEAATTTSDAERFRARIEELEDSARALVVPNEFARILTSWGGRGLNATTSNEATLYYVDLPANRLEHWFALEAERMSDPVFREFHTERDVVMEERRLRVETSPGGRLYEAHLAAAWQAHPYRQPVVGTMDDLRSLTRSQVAAYYRRYYGARNAVVAIVGAVDPDAVVAMAERWFGPIRPGEPAPTPTFDEPEPDGPVRTTIEWDAEPLVRVGWKIPPGDHPDTPALTVLSVLLTGGRTSLLHRGLVQGSRSVTSIISSFGPGESLERLFTIDAAPRSPATPREVEEEIMAGIRRLAREGVDPEALERVRNQLASSEVRRLTSNFGLALQLAESTATRGDWRATFRFTSALRAVTGEQVVEAVERWLRPERMVVATLVPSAGENAP